MSTHDTAAENRTEQQSLVDVDVAEDETESDECDCADLPEGVPCAECYIAGEADWETPRHASPADE